jgi:SOS-response transcriptional repressor LexA
MNKNEQNAKFLRDFGERNFPNMSAFARAIGISPQHLYKHLRGKNPLPIGATLRERLAVVGITKEVLDGQTKGAAIPLITLVNIPVYESVHAGEKGMLIREDIVEYLAVPVSGDETRFGVIVKGDSMSPRINSGDTIVVSEIAEVRNGDLAIVNWNDGEFNLRVVTYSGDNVILTSENSAKFPPVIVAKSHIHKLFRVMMRIEKF